MNANTASAVVDPVAPLREFVVAMTRLVESVSDEPALLAQGRKLLSALIADDAWLPPQCAEADPSSYRQYLLYCDPLERFSVVSFVWGPGQKTPVHDHTVWGLVGMLRGAELCREYAPEGDRVVSRGLEHVLKPGMVEAVSPTVGDWHVVANALPDRPSISIHVYGANIGAVRRHMLDAQGRICDFVSGYSSPTMPNLWDRSAAVRAQAA
jgi:predicted metal-dependent enzyme (double-stranded beta helix superfamily)